MPKPKLLRINLVAVALVLIAVALGYGAWKFVPPYWQARKVDEVLAGAKFEAARVDMFSGDSRAEDLTNRVRERIVDLGINDEYLEVYFSDDMTSLHADYTVWVYHPVGPPTALTFQRTMGIPTADTGN